jgi:large subunit ribosomal protein L6
MLLKELIYTVDLPEGVTVSMEKHDVKLSGPRGDLNRIFKHPLISLSEDNGNLKLVGKKLRRKEKALIGTWRAHLRNMVQGVSNGFLYEMKIVFAHFPMKVSVKGNVVHVANFLGEKTTRLANIHGNAKVIAKGDKVTIEGNNVEDVGQTAANLEQATVVKGRDIRVFQDGIYVVSKGAAQ